MGYIARTAPPDYTSLNAIAVMTKGVKYGGKNHAMAINKTTGCVYANCTGHVHLRALELCGEAVEKRLCTGNASAYWEYTQDGLERGQEPRLGAIAVWGGGSKGYGHVALVESIYSNGDFGTGNSNYSGNPYYNMRVYKSKNYQPWSGYKLKGFIYLPWQKEMKCVGTPVERDTSKLQVGVCIAGLRARKRPEMNDEVILGFTNKGIYNVLETRDMTAEASNGQYWYIVEKDDKGDPSLCFARKEGEWNKLYEPIVLDVNELQAKVKSLEAEVHALRVELETDKDIAARYIEQNAKLETTLGEVNAVVIKLRSALTKIATTASEAAKGE